MGWLRCNVPKGFGCKYERKRGKSVPKNEDQTSIFQTNGILSPALVEWADAIWEDGNDASHDSDPFSKEEAERILSFNEIYLRYVYTLPGMLAERKAETSNTP